MTYICVYQQPWIATFSDNGNTFSMIFLCDKFISRNTWIQDIFFSRITFAMDFITLLLSCCMCKLLFHSLHINMNEKFSRYLHLEISYQTVSVHVFAYSALSRNIFVIKSVMILWITFYFIARKKHFKGVKLWYRRHLLQMRCERYQTDIETHKSKKINL